MTRRGQPVTERWKQHLEAAFASGQSIAAYAREHGLNRKSLYWANARLRKQSRVGRDAVKPSASLKKTRGADGERAFVAVRVRDTPQRLSAPMSVERSKSLTSSL